MLRPLTDLYSRLGVSFGRFRTHLDLIVVVKELLFVVTVLRFHIRQHQDKMSIAIAITVDCPLYSGRSNSIKVTVSAYQKFNILFLYDKVMQ